MSLKRRLTIVDTDDGDKDFIQTALKVAFATTDMETVNQHFGSALGFSIYVLDPNKIKLFEVVQFGETQEDGNEDKLQVKLDALEGCVAVYSQAIGASAIALLKAGNIQPVRVVAGACI
ncbi:Nitrogenase FeMo-cofactor carrier protein NifX, partial [hydrothermal vent metagenome]